MYRPVPFACQHEILAVQQVPKTEKIVHSSITLTIDIDESYFAALFAGQS
jgi:hypothetical protein